MIVQRRCLTVVYPQFKIAEDVYKRQTVDWGNKDFKFANNTYEPIYIVGYVDGFEQVYIGLYGRL